MGLLSGTFYSVDKLAPAFRAFSHANPFFYIISGFRYGFLGTANSPILVGRASRCSGSTWCWRCLLLAASLGMEDQELGSARSVLTLADRNK